MTATGERDQQSLAERNAALLEQAAKNPNDLRAANDRLRASNNALNIRATQAEARAVNAERFAEEKAGLVKAIQSLREQVATLTASLSRAEERLTTVWRILDENDSATFGVDDGGSVSCDELLIDVGARDTLTDLLDEAGKYFAEIDTQYDEPDARATPPESGRPNE